MIILCDYHKSWFHGNILCKIAAILFEPLFSTPSRNLGESGEQLVHFMTCLPDSTWINNHISPNAGDLIICTCAWIPRLSNKFHCSDSSAPVIDMDDLKQLILGALNSCTWSTWQNGRRFADDIFVNEKFCILMQISLKFVPKGLIDNMSALLQVTAWRLKGDKPLNEPMMTHFNDAYMWH